MIPREKFINKLRELGYTFKRDCDRTYLWRRGVHRVFVPKKSTVSEEWARQTLRQCGVSDAEIDKFVRAANA